MTTTTIEKMLARAQEYEEKSRALRVAAAEMNGHAQVVKQATMPTTLARAVKLRRKQRPEPEAATVETPPEIANPDNHASETERRQAIITHYLGSNGPQPLRAITEHLTQFGVDVTPSRISQILQVTPNVKKRGKGVHTVWVLKKT
jgi:hypothetical protein